MPGLCIFTHAFIPELSVPSTTKIAIDFLSNIALAKFQKWAAAWYEKRVWAERLYFSELPSFNYLNFEGGLLVHAKLYTLADYLLLPTLKAQALSVQCNVPHLLILDLFLSMLMGNYPYKDH